MTDFIEGEVVSAEEGAPEGGWLPEDFPQITLAPIPYTSNPNIRTDPSISVMETGWIYIETGQTRIAIPDEEEWLKLVNMVNRMLVTHKQRVAEAVEALSDQDVEVEDYISGMPEMPNT